MSMLLCLPAGLLIVICCWFLTDPDCIQIYEEDVTGCSGAIDYVPASVARQLETELAAMKARAEKAEAAIIEKNAPEIAKINAEFASREAEVERLTELLRIESAASAHALLWAEKAEAELATERARLDWLLARKPHIRMMSHKCQNSCSWDATYSNRAAIDANMKEPSK